MINSSTYTKLGKQKKIIFFFFIGLLFILGIRACITPGVDEGKNLLKEIQKIATQELSNQGVDYSVLIKDLRVTNKKHYFGVRKQFPAASLIKLPILAAALIAIDEGKISLQEKIVIRRKDISGGSGKLKAYKLPHTLTVKELLELMISISDNTASNKIIDILGFDYLEKAFKNLKLEDTVLARKLMDFSLRAKGVENYTSAFDVAFILEGLYNHSIASKELCELSLGFLKNQKVKDRLPKHLPENIALAHKTGLERGVVHDAGIVFTGSSDYLICVLVKNERSYSKAKKFIALVSLLTYNLYH